MSSYGKGLALWRNTPGCRCPILQEGCPEEIIARNFDKVIIAAGYKSNNELADALEEKVRDLSPIGDANAPRKIMTAVHEGCPTIRLMDQAQPQKIWQAGSAKEKA